MKTSTKIAVATFVLGILGVATITQTTYALSKETFNKVAEAVNRNWEANDDLEEVQEVIQLQKLAKISLQQASQAAQQKIGGEPHQVELENENGNLVYTVEIGETEVIVDAGNGRVLYVEKLNQEDNEAAEASRPRSSIQVPNSQNNDRETNDDN
ncbi:peptidase [Aphanothece hegewaldii CCALA 016]|uniref:Peptidase n=1 Tax=Aphanothece hegewaldii CCALA 016 TaxID=2107694 RepID=A0A2T1LSG5_9CHRO|nr:PepSY domain-containing protein [Aphanothece hegewaldii]PSF32930.1 peptidase [Aphanothece hegewaldii CCALA 016]